MANTKVTGDLIASSTIATGNIADNAVTSDKISGITTAHITEGSNLYYTDARARGAVSVSGNALAYNSSTGVITSNFEESPTFTGNITFGDSHFIGDDADDNLLIQSSANENIIINSVDDLFLRTGGTTKLVVKNGGNVGIGTTSPGAKLEINDGSTQTELRISVTGDTGYSTINFADASDINPGQIYYHHQQNLMNFRTNDNDRMVISSTGNVGIGTTSPEKNLSIGGSQAEGIQFNYDTTNNYRNQILNYWNSNTDTRMDFNIARTSGQTPETIMSVGYNSNVGIGTTSPSSKLHVHATSGDGFVRITGDNIINSGGAIKGFNNGLAFNVAPSGGGSEIEAIRIQGNGNIGIGTASPNSKLNINGASAHLNFTGSNNRINFSGYRAIEGSHTGSLLQIGEGYSNTSLYGNVGIGNTSPDAFLHIGGAPAISAEALIVRGNANGQYAVSIEQDNSSGFGMVIDTDSTDSSDPAFKVQNPNGSLFDVRSDGNVGIGTTSPDLKLDVTHATAGEYVATFQNTGANLELKLGVTSTSYLNIQGQQINNSNPFNISLQADGGNVGIGTTSPGYKLTVAGEIALDSYLRHNGNSNTFFGFSGNDEIKFRTAGSDRIFINSSGNVGIGSTSPDNILHIETSNAGGPQIQLESTSGTASAAFINFDSTSLQLSTQRDMVDGDWYDTSKSWGGINIQGPAGGSFITFHTAAASNSSPSERIRITSDGSVGIGTTSPSSFNSRGRNLVVAGGGDVGITIDGASSGSGTLLFADGTGGTAAYRGSIEYDHADDSMAFSTAAAERMRISSAGNVQIGTTNNSAKLNVGGPILAQDNNQSAGMYVRRSLNLIHPGSTGTFTRTFNPVTQFGISRLGGNVLLEVSGWSQRLNCGYIQFQNAGGSGNITTVSYTQIAVQGNGSISVSVNSANDNSIDINFSGWHGNSHAFQAKIVTQ